MVSFRGPWSHGGVRIYTPPEPGSVPRSERTASPVAPGLSSPIHAVRVLKQSCSRAAAFDASSFDGDTGLCRLSAAASALAPSHAISRGGLAGGFCASSPTLAPAASRAVETAAGVPGQAADAACTGCVSWDLARTRASATCGAPAASTQSAPAAGAEACWQRRSKVKSTSCRWWKDSPVSSSFNGAAPDCSGGSDASHRAVVQPIKPPPA